MARQASLAAKRHQPPLPLQGVRLIRPLMQALEHLHGVGTQRDRAGNRRLFYDQYLGLLLLYFFNPTLTSLRALQQATNWGKTQKKFGIPRTSLGSLSEAAGVFDASFVEPIVRELAEQALPLTDGREAEALRGLTAVDSSIFPALSRMAWALWQDDRHRGLRLHLHFDVLKAAPRQARVTPAAYSELIDFADSVEPNRLYVLDRGFASYSLFAQVLAAGSSLVARVRGNLAFTVQEERVITPEAARAGVVRDVVLSRLGTTHRRDEFRRPMRLTIVRCVERDGCEHELSLITDRLDLDADLVALAYQRRWTVELFFRWLKSILGARHLTSHSQNGVQLQMYAAMIVSLLMVLRTQVTPTKRTLEMISLYLMGWVSDVEFDAYIAALRLKSKSKNKNS